ncbi:MAG: L,D-transpeptidase [Rikenellaceae bacterium]|nr:L,D-transpeptidase [Rikenellaceae bacterium]
MKLLLLLCSLSLASCATQRNSSAVRVVERVIEVDRPVEVRVEVPVAQPLSGSLLVSKRAYRLTVLDSLGREQLQLPIACGINYGQKEKEGDMKTPEGTFTIQEIQDASQWKHDFKDGLGMIEGAYGPYFIRLKTPPHKGIGIHGTHLPSSIGSRATEGCIRLTNEDLKRLVRWIYVGMPVVVEAD